MQWREVAVAAEEKQLMGHLIEQNDTGSLAAKEWLRDAMSPFDVVATLSMLSHPPGQWSGRSIPRGT